MRFSVHFVQLGLHLVCNLVCIFCLFQSFCVFQRSRCLLNNLLYYLTNKHLITTDLPTLIYTKRGKLLTFPLILRDSPGLTLWLAWGTFTEKSTLKESVYSQSFNNSNSKASFSHTNLVHNLVCTFVRWFASLLDKDNKFRAQNKASTPLIATFCRQKTA